MIDFFKEINEKSLVLRSSGLLRHSFKTEKITMLRITHFANKIPRFLQTFFEFDRYVYFPHIQECETKL